MSDKNEHVVNNLGGGEFICPDCGRHLVFDEDNMRVIAKGDFDIFHSGGKLKINNAVKDWKDLAVQEMLGG